jgi:hypothetical protein
MASTLRVLAMLVSILALLLKMRPSRVPGECHTDVTPAALPDAERDPIKETSSAAPHGDSNEGLTLRTIAQAIVDSKGEARLTDRWFMGAAQRPRSRRRPGPSNQLSARVAFRLQPQSGTSLEACAGPRPSPGIRWLLRNRA